jgi:integrase
VFLVCEFIHTYLSETLRQIRLEQIKVLLGHSSTQTTERYLGSEREIAIAVNDNIGL